MDPDNAALPPARLGPAALAFHALHDPDAQRLAAEAAAGLQARPAHASPKFFYDALGSRLFDAITELDEYTPTRAEAGIFERERNAIATAVQARLPQGFSLYDLGAGDGAKAASFFAALQPRRYVAIDISVDFLRGALAKLQREHPGLPMVGVGLDFSAALALPAALSDGPALVFYPGSSIGNFAPDAALRLLREARALAAGGALLIGVDLVKHETAMVAAYDDPLGVTAAFNLNLLRHLNRLLGADFDPRAWQHVARFNREQSRIEMHLRARHALSVRWTAAGGSERPFAAGESIHTENSYKWRPDDFGALLHDAGYRAVRRFGVDADGFGVFLAA